MEVESEDEDDHRDHRHEGHPSQPDQDTQLQDMDEVRAEEFHLGVFKCFGTCVIRGLGLIRSGGFEESLLNISLLSLYFFRDLMMRLHFLLKTRCHPHCPQLQTKLSFAKIMIRKVEKAFLYFFLSGKCIKC